LALAQAAVDAGGDPNTVQFLGGLRWCQLEQRVDPQLPVPILNPDWWHYLGLDLDELQAEYRKWSGASRR
jgi:hypothetical protein